MVEKERTDRARVAIVGRERELEEIDRALVEAIAGRGQVRLVVGEPGIGKTRLAQEAALRAGARGAAVLWGRCWEDRGAPAYWPWIQVIRASADTTDRAAFVAALGPAAAHVARIVPEMGTLAGEANGAASGSPPPGADPERERFQLFDHITGFLRRLAAERPLVLVFDDLHAADVPSLRLLAFLARWVVDSRILVVCTCRETETVLDPLVGPLLGDLVRHGSRIALGGLSEVAIARYIEEAFAVSSPATLVAAVHQACNGNPLFVGEVARLLMAQGRLGEPVAGAGDGGFPIPDSVRGVIRQRLRRLTAACRRVLAFASAIGRSLDVALLEHASGLAPPLVRRCLDEAGVAGILTAVEGAPGRRRFCHGLVHETIYDDLPPLERAELHRRIGTSLEEMHAGATDRHLPELAHHFFEAARDGEESEKAIDYNTRAGRRAMALIAYEEAVGYFERALEALQLSREAAPGEDPHRRCTLLLALGDARNRSGEVAKARPAFQAAAELARSSGTPELLAQAALGIGGAMLGLPDGMVDPGLVGLLEESLGALGEGASPLHVAVLSRLATELYYTPERGRREELSRSAVEMARRLGDRSALAAALSARHFVLWGPGNLGERLAAANEIVEIAPGLGRRELEAQGRIWRFLDLLEMGEAGLTGEAEQVARIAAELRQPHYLALASILRGLLALHEGRFESAEELAGEAFTVAGSIGQSAARWSWALVIALRREQGRLAELAQAIAAAAAERPGISAYRALLALAWAEAGREVEARRDLAALAAQDFAGLPEDANWMISVAYLSEVCSRLGDGARAAALYDRLLAQAGVGQTIVCGTGPVAHYLGVLASTAGRFPEAGKHFETAIEVSDRVGARPFAARSRACLGRMLLAHGGEGDRERGRRLLGSALDIARAIGMGALTGEVETLLGESPAEAGQGGVPSDAAEAATAREEKEPRESALHREGEYWTASFEGRVFRLKDSKGLAYLACLLGEPGREFHAAEMISAVHGGSGGLTAGRLGDLGQLLDPRAKAEYRTRLGDLREEIDRARAANDPGRAERLETEIEFITRELARAVGLGGRDRAAGSAAERARLSVTKALRTTLRRIVEHCPPLGQHLDATIRTGLTCSYNPDPRVPIRWRLSADR